MILPHIPPMLLLLYPTCSNRQCLEVLCEGGTRDTIRSSGSWDIICDKYHHHSKEMCSEAKHSELNPKVRAVTEVPLFWNDSFSIKSKVEAEWVSKSTGNESMSCLALCITSSTSGCLDTFQTQMIVDGHSDVSQHVHPVGLYLRFADTIYVIYFICWVGWQLSCWLRMKTSQLSAMSRIICLPHHPCVRVHRNTHLLVGFPECLLLKKHSLSVLGRQTQQMLLTFALWGYMEVVSSQKQEDACHL